MIIKAVCICIISVFAILIVKNILPSFSPVIAIGAGILTIVVCVPQLMNILESINSLSKKVYGIDNYLKISIKIVVISLLCEFSSQLCSDNGENYLASKIEFAGKVSIMIVAAPEFAKLINKVTDMLLLL